MSRVRFTPGSISGVVRSRKRRACDGHLADRPHFIEAGQTCVANALPPYTDLIENSGWWHMWVCMDCCPPEFAPVVAPSGEGSE